MFVNICLWVCSFIVLVYCEIVCVWYDAFMASCDVFEFNHIGTCLFPVVLLGLQFQVLFVGGRDCVVKLLFALLVCFSFGLDSCMFGFGL